jgi:hypothetical protein
LRPLGSIKAPYSARHENDFICAALAGIALSEERQLNGYRVPASSKSTTSRYWPSRPMMRARKRTFAEATGSKTSRDPDPLDATAAECSPKRVGGLRDGA